MFRGLRALASVQRRAVVRNASATVCRRWMASAVPKATKAVASGSTAAPGTGSITASELDHRVVGRSQGLFMFHPYSAGSAFFLPHGTRVYNTLIDYLRGEYRKRGYDEVRSPLLYDKQLWITSGHWENYKENMFVVESDKPQPTTTNTAAAAAAAAGTAAAATNSAPATAAAAPAHVHGAGCSHDAESGSDASGTFALKAMNCPGHCLLYASTLHSYRDLPVRFADFSPLHRNEITGALSGLTRVRRFAQDDAHIFCRFDQIGQEIGACLDFVRDVYAIFGFSFRCKLSTRPDKYLGDAADWDNAERILGERLTAFVASANGAAGASWELNAKDGAFYGPKIDIVLTDAHKREHQCATIQLDFQLPKRFQLIYRADDGSNQTPVMIHRAILGSVERMMAVLIEHTGGKWPFWLSPRQVMICPISSIRHMDYARAVQKQLLEWNPRAFVDIDTTDHSVSKKVRNAQLAQYNYMLVVGDAEAANGTVAVRVRDKQTSETVSVATLTQRFDELLQSKK